MGAKFLDKIERWSNIIFEECIAVELAKLLLRIVLGQETKEMGGSGSSLDNDFGRCCVADYTIVWGEDCFGIKLLWIDEVLVSRTHRLYAI